MGLRIFPKTSRVKNQPPPTRWAPETSVINMSGITPLEEVVNIITSGKPIYFRRFIGVYSSICNWFSGPLLVESESKPATPWLESTLQIFFAGVSCLQKNTIMTNFWKKTTFFQLLPSDLNWSQKWRSLKETPEKVTGKNLFIYLAQTSQFCFLVGGFQPFEKYHI